MSFTREFIRKAAKESGVEIPKELEDVLVQEHLSARDAYATAQVKTALDENKPEPVPAVKDTPEYKDLKERYDTLANSVSAEKERAAKEKAYRALLKSANIEEKHHDQLVRASAEDINNIEFDENGNVKNSNELTGKIKTNWSSFVRSETETGAQTPNPPANNGGKMTRAEIYAKDEKGRYKYEDAERKRLIAENPEAFPNAFGINKGGI